MKARLIAYWVTTALTAFVFLSGGLVDILQPPDVIKGMTDLGWAYAGMFFDLSGASASHAAVGDPVAKIVTPLVLLGIVMASWALRPDSRTLGGTTSRPAIA